MSVFATLAEFRASLGQLSADPIGLYDQLTDRVQAQTANDAVGQDILDRAESTVRTYLGARYALPDATPTDPLLAAELGKLTLDIAGYRAAASNPLFAHPGIRKVLKELHDEALALLRRIAEGTANLPGGTPLPGPTAGGPTSVAFGHGQVFTEEATEGL